MVKLNVRYLLFAHILELAENFLCWLCQSVNGNAPIFLEVIGVYNVDLKCVERLEIMNPQCFTAVGPSKDMCKTPEMSLCFKFALHERQLPYHV